MAAIMGIPRPMPHDQNRIRPKNVTALCPTDELAGARSTVVAGRGPAGPVIPGLRESDDEAPKLAHQPRPKRQLPKHLRILTAPPKPRARPKSAAPAQSGPPPLARLLSDAGLGHYAKKLCESMSVSTIRQVLNLDRAALDALIDSLRPLPGHRVRILQFVDQQRALAAAATSSRDAESTQRDDDTTAAPSAGVNAATKPLIRPHTAAGAGPSTALQQQRKFRTTAASLAAVARRGKDGPISHAMIDQPGAWGIKGSHAPSHAVASRVHVVKVAGGGRRVEYDGPRPNAPVRPPR